MLSGTFHGPDGISKFVEDRETGLLGETGRCTEERDQKLQSNSADIGDVEVVCIVYYSALGEGKREPKNWKNLYVGGMHGIRCQHFQAMVTNLLQKHWEWQEEWNPALRHGTVVRPTMYLASLNIKTAFDEAKPPKHVAQILDYHNTHGWLIAAHLREMSGLEGKAMFECVESCFSFNRCLRQGSVEAPRLWHKMATQIWANVEEEWMRKRSGILVDLEGEGVHQICSFMWADNFRIMSHSKDILEQMIRDLIAEANRWDLVPKLASLWWTSTSGCYTFPFEDTFKILGCAMNRQGKTHDAIEERMQWANKAFGKDILIYTSKDVPWKVKCQRLVDQNVQYGQKDMDTDGLALSVSKKCREYTDFEH